MVSGFFCSHSPGELCVLSWWLSMSSCMQPHGLCIKAAFGMGLWGKGLSVIPKSSGMVRTVRLEAMPVPVYDPGDCLSNTASGLS